MKERKSAWVGEPMIQEIFQHDPWKLLIGCIFQNLTTGKQVRAMMYDFFDKYPTAQLASIAIPSEMESMLRPLGMQIRRTKTIIKFSTEYLHKDWKRPIELTGIGKYGQDSYDIFIKGDLTVQANDKELKAYLIRKHGNS